MRRAPAKRLYLLLGLLIALWSTIASANKLDLTISRFYECVNNGTQCRAHNSAYEKFMAEYAFGVAPKLLSGASTLGYSGFYLGIESSIVTLPKTGDANFDGTNFEDARWRIGSGEYGAVPPAMLFPTIHVRKGLPWSLEVGSSISYLAQSELVGLGGEVKWSPFEGYRHHFRGVLPDVGVRGTVNRILGETDVDMTIVGVDGSLSYPFGIGGMISLEPYAGYQFLWTIIRTEPMILRTDTGSGATFHSSESGSYDVSASGLSGPDLTRSKIFFGLNFRYELLSVTMDWAFGLPRDWTTTEYTQKNADGTFANGDAGKISAKVHVDTQFAFSLGTALQF